MNSINRICQAVASRRAEIAQYELEEKIHEAAVAKFVAEGVPVEFPEHLAAFAGMDRDKLSAACPPADLDTVVDIQEHLGELHELSNVRIELKRTRSRLAALEPQLPSGHAAAVASPFALGLAALPTADENRIDSSTIADTPAGVRFVAVSKRDRRTLVIVTGDDVETFAVI